jgi:hypothetical protein
LVNIHVDRQFVADSDGVRGGPIAILSRHGLDDAIGDLIFWLRSVADAMQADIRSIVAVRQRAAVIAILGRREAGLQLGVNAVVESLVAIVILGCPLRRPEAG